MIRFDSVVAGSIGLNDSLNVYTAEISSVGNGGKYLNVVDLSDENRGVRNASPYGFISSPPPKTTGYFLIGQRKDSDALIGVLQDNIPQEITGGSAMLYSSSGARVITNADGSVDIVTTNGQSLKINGEYITDMSLTDAQIQQIIDLIEAEGIDAEDLIEFLDELGLTELDIKQWIADANIQQTQELQTYMASNYVDLTNYNGKMNALIRALSGLDADWGTIQDHPDLFRANVGHTLVTDEFFTQMLEGVDLGLEVFTGASTPTLDNYPFDTWTPQEKLSHVGDLYLVNEYGGDDAGYYYILTNSGTEENPIYSWEVVQDGSILGLIGDVETIGRKLTTEHYTIDQIDSLFEVMQDGITLQVESYKTDVINIITEVNSTVNGIENTLEYYNENATQTDARITLLEGEIVNKVSQRDYNIMVDSVGNMQRDIAEHYTELKQTTDSITSTVSERFDSMKVGSRNLIVNSPSMIYTDYKFVTRQNNGALIGAMIIGEAVIGEQ